MGKEEKMGVERQDFDYYEMGKECFSAAKAGNERRKGSSGNR